LPISFLLLGAAVVCLSLPQVYSRSQDEKIIPKVGDVAKEKEFIIGKPWERKVIDRLWHNIKVGKSHRNDSSGINDEGVSGDLLFARAVITLPQLIFFHLL